MTRIHDDEVNKIAECNLLHAIINPYKVTKNLKSYHSPILRGYMNTRRGRAKFKDFQILLDVGFSSTIVIIGLFEKLIPETDDVIQWHMQDGNITTNLKV